MRLTAEINKLLRFLNIYSANEIREIHLVEFERTVRTLQGSHTEHAVGWRIVTPDACILDVEKSPAGCFKFEGDRNNVKYIIRYLLSHYYSTSAIASILGIAEKDVLGGNNNG